MAELLGIVLCGGQSRRMGMPKHQLPFGEHSLLEHSLRTLTEVVGSPESLIVVAAVGQDLQLNLPGDQQVRVVRDQSFDSGPLEGIAAGLAVAHELGPLAFVTSCDVPFLKTQFVERMQELLGEQEIAAVDDGTYRHPLGAVYRTSLFARARIRLQQGERSVQSLLDNCQTRFVSPIELADVDPKLESLRNLNSPEDYFEAARAAGVEIPVDVRSALSPELQ